jgi:drug/metabolite transporter (DMT)-like permease
MIYLLLSILLSVGLLVNFRLFPKFGIPTFPVIILNYPVCFLLGYLLMEKGQKFTLDLNQPWTWYCLALGVGFIITFMLSGKATQKIGMTLTSLANNISLVIPVLFSLLVFGSSLLSFTPLNYLGLALGLVAVGIATYKVDGDRRTGIFWQSGGLALAVFLCYGISNTAINYIQINLIKDSPGAIPVMLIMVLGAIVTGSILGVYRWAKGKDNWNYKVLLAAFTLGIPNFLSFYYLILALNHFGSSGAFVYPLYNMGVILVSAGVSVWIFKEKLSKLNKIGLGLAILAILLISWNSLFIKPFPEFLSNFVTFFPLT